MFSLKMNLRQRMEPIWLSLQTWYFNNNYLLRRRPLSCPLYVLLISALSPLFRRRKLIFYQHLISNRPLHSLNSSPFILHGDHHPSDYLIRG
jgi:hypothetical protein